MTKGGHYLLALKENQGNLYEDAVFGFKTCPVESVSEEWEYGHGQYEVRKCNILPSEEVVFPEIQEQWCGLKTLIRVECIRQINDRKMEETRYYISDEEGLSAAFLTQRPEGAGILKIIYTGIWTLLSGKIAAGQGREMHLKISPR
jgi:hypothetical protein